MGHRQIRTCRPGPLQGQLYPPDLEEGIPIPLDESQGKPQGLVVKPDRPLQVGHLEMHVADGDAGINGAKAA